jgi:hypothetical protein
LRKDLTAAEEAAEEYERNKLNAERIRKKLEGELQDLAVFSPSSVVLFRFNSFLNHLVLSRVRANFEEEGRVGSKA